MIASTPIGIIVALAIAAFVWSPSAASALAAEDYFPIAPGNTWTYDVDGATEVETVLSETGFENGVVTSIIGTMGRELDARTEWTNDGSGLFQHAQSDFEFRGLFNPAYKFLNADFMIGDVVVNSGNLTGTLVGFPSQTFPFSGNSRVLRQESVTVPFGTFDAVVVEATLTAVGETEVDTLWLVDGIGLVKAEYRFQGIVSTSELVLTNVPEPSAGALGLGALATLGGLNIFRVVRSRERQA
jgi:hypothetical protein